jgi:hypothetical protein
MDGFQAESTRPFRFLSGEVEASFFGLRGFGCLREVVAGQIHRRADFPAGQPTFSGQSILLPAIQLGGRLAKKADA